MKPCLGIPGKLFDHSYITVYATHVEGEETNSYQTLSDIRTETPVSTYCERCGDKIPFDSTNTDIK